MLNKLLEYNYSAIGIFFFIALVKTILFLTGQVDSGEYSYSLFRIFEDPSFWGGMVSALVTVLLGILILVNSERNAKRNDFSFWLVLIFSIQLCFNRYYSISVEHIGLFFFILSFFSFSKSIAIQQKTKSTIDSFNLSFTMALGCLFTPHLVYMIPLFWLGLILIGNASPKGFLASLLGFSVPFLLIDTTIFSLYYGEATYTHLYLWEQLMREVSTAPMHLGRWEQVANIGPLALIVMSIMLTFKYNYTVKTVVRKFNFFNVLMLAYTFIMVTTGLIPAHFGMMITFVSTSYLFSNFQTLATTVWRNVFLVVLLVSAVISYPPVINGIISLFQMIF